jgi:teichuronic acid exporter
MTSSLKARAARGVFWTALNQVGSQGVQLVTGIILARLLIPAEFGLIAMLMVFMGIATSFVDSGFGAALIQKQNLNSADTSTVFYFNLMAGGALTLILYTLAPMISQFYDEPVLTPLTRVLALNVIINAFGVVQTNLLTKYLEFRRQTIATVTGTLIGGAVGIVMAVQGFGVWSLVAQSLTGNAARTVSLWFVSDWRPVGSLSIAALRFMFGFGSRLLASGMIFTVVNNMHSLVIGKLFAAAELGLFTQARRLQELPTVGMTGILSQVAFPIFASIQDDNQRLRRGFQKALTTAVFVNFPLMIGLSACAKPTVILLLTEKWLPCVPYLQLFCIVGMTYPLHVINLNLLIAKGRSDQFLKLEIIKQVLVLVGIALSWPFGVSGLIIGQIVVSVISYYLNGHYAGKLIDYSFRQQSRDIAPYLGAAIVMGVVIYAVTWFSTEMPISILIIQVGVGVGIYLAACRLFRLSALAEIWSMVRQKVSLPSPV